MNLQIHCDYVVPVHRWSSTDELAAHSHSVTSSTQRATGTLGTGGESEYFYKSQTGGVFSNGTSNGKGAGNSNGLKDRTGYLNFNYSHSHTVTINKIGNNTAHENRQPYIVIYRFRRVG